MVNFRNDHATNHASGLHPSMGGQWLDKGRQLEKVKRAQKCPNMVYESLHQTLRRRLLDLK